MKIAAIILAAGLSTRMKTNKLQLDLQGMTLIERVLLKVSAVDFFEKIIVTNDPLIEERSKALKFIPVANELTALGQSSSIKEGVLHASREVEGYLFVMGDQPLLSKETLERILLSFKESPSSIILPVYGGKPGSPVLFPSSLREEFLLLEGDVGGKVLIQAHPELVRTVGIPSEEELIDIDTLEDYETAKKRLQKK